jgi:protease II
VQYWEPAKWVAKLRELKTDDNLLLLCTDMDSGHGGNLRWLFNNLDRMSPELRLTLKHYLGE